MVQGRSWPYLRPAGGEGRGSSEGPPGLLFRVRPDARPCEEHRGDERPRVPVLDVDELLLEHLVLVREELRLDRGHVREGRGRVLPQDLPDRRTRTDHTQPL